MSDMKQEDKAKAYDKVRKKIAIRFGSNVADEFFAEFEESKDERVRKALKQYFVNSFQNNGVAAICGVHVKDVLAWLEKQCKPKEYTFKSLPRLLDMIEPTSRAKAYCQKLIDILVKEGYTTDAKIVRECLKTMNGEDVSMAVMDEKQGEQKPNPYTGVSFEYNGHIWGMCARDNGVDILLDKQLFKHLEKQGEQKETNLVEILKHYPKETELYSPLYGKLWLAEVDEKNEIITCYKHHLEEGCTRAVLEQEDTVSFYSNGTTGLPDFNVSKDCMLFLYDIVKQGEQKDSYTTIVETGNGGINALVTLPIEMKTAEESLGISSDEYNKIVDECLFGEQKLTEFERGLFDMLTDISKPCTADCVKSHSEKLLSIARKMIALEQKPTDSYCKENCKGFQETGKCFADGDCKAKREADSTNEVEPKFKVGDKIYLKPEYRMPNDDTPIANTVKEIIRIDDKHYRFDGSYIFIEDQDKYALVEQKPAWSEEDEQRLNSCLNILQPKTFVGNTETRNTKWLKSLKGRVQPQPKQEWNEEDEQHIDSLLKRLDALCRNKFERTRFAISEDRDWLKSLRPLKRWKPSDEQIDLLQAIINEPNNASSESCQIALKDILEQLKKLKEG